MLRAVFPDWGDRTHVMGVLNVTPDSFSDGGRFEDLASARAAGLAMAEAGADLIDVGGESTRPGSAPVSLEEECRRVLPVVEALHAAQLKVSIDTSKAEVARRAVEAGAILINDISGFQFDPNMWSVAADNSVLIALGHTRSRPADMQSGELTYEGGVVQAVDAFFGRCADEATAHGISLDRILWDPGIGFGKTVEQNLALLRAGHVFGERGAVLVGTSRKSFLGAITGRPVEQREAASIASVALAIQSGASMVRVHDVGASLDAARIADAYKQEKKPTT